ncbi:hypothetical protein K1T71_005001 [Dendrolimus kikuchii]|uniref:Uncharacterized protein n=1 Tax=Dendrolimus kikuchii TaxID=765133 RepID=A0ACC1D6D7_9NEOP|nr:hypothetical protein K1T71_005001 [Dendrolimus kikuchii]
MSVEGNKERVIRGWGCTPTGDPPPAAVAAEQQTSSNKTCLPTIFGRGWRRNTLYGILMLLMLLVFLNFILTLWIISVLKLNMKGLGLIKIIKGGVELEGDAWVLNNLVASSITSQPAQPITLHSHRNFTIHVSDQHRMEHSKLLIKRDSIEFSGRSFHIRDARGGSVFHASRDEVRVSADMLTVDGQGGLAVKSALQAPFVRAPPGSNLQLESLTRRLDLRAPQSIYLESRAGSIDVTSQSNIKLNSIVGAIKIDAPNIIISNLKEASTTDRPQKNVRNKKVYQLCACTSGKLFLAAPDAACAARDDDTELCR